MSKLRQERTASKGVTLPRHIGSRTVPRAALSFAVIVIDQLKQKINDPFVPIESRKNLGVYSSNLSISLRPFRTVIGD